MIDIDYTGSQILQQTIAGLRFRSIEVAIARLSDPRAQSEASRTGLITSLGPERVFKSVEEAVRRICRMQNWNNPSKKDDAGIGAESD
jgi:hypothetical protein